MSRCRVRCFPICRPMAESPNIRLAPDSRSQSRSAFLTNQIKQHFNVVLWIIGHRYHVISLTSFSYSFSRCLHSWNRLFIKKSHGNTYVKVIQCYFCNKTVDRNTQQPFILTTWFENVLQSAIQIWLVYAHTLKKRLSFLVKGYPTNRSV